MVRPGDAAPDFDLPDQDGRRVRLADHKGRALVLYFYPRDFTPGCTREACGFRDEETRLRTAGAEILGVSADPPGRHAAFARRHRLPFRLLSDEGGALARRYDVRPGFLGLLPGRATFVIDGRGVVRHRFDSQFRAGRHVEEALAAVERLAKEAA